MAQDDFALLERWRSGDQKAGTDLFERYFDQLYRFFRNKVSEGAEDLVQETFLACVRTRDRFAGLSSFRTYVFRIAHSKLYDHLRRKQRSEAIDFGVTSVVDLGESPSALMARGEEEKLLLAALRRLPVDLQIVLELHYIEKIRGPELAQILDIPEGTVRSRLRRGKEQLRVQAEELTASPGLVESTVTDLDAWAEKIRQFALAADPNE